MECASKIVERAVDVVLDLTIRHVSYIFCYEKNVEELCSFDEKLSLQRKRLVRAVEKAKDNLGITESDVTDWLRKVDETRTETEEFQNDKGHKKTGFSSGLFQYFRNRHRLGRKAKKMLEVVKSLIDESKFDGVSYQQKPTSMHAALRNADYVEIDSREDMIDSIIKELEDSTVRMIGVHGPGGVGKSTLIKEIAKKAQVKKLFDVVVIVEITDNPDLRKIQEEIAYLLDLSLEVEGESVRADRLRRRLKQERENTLVVMDDLWDRIDLNKIGIPFDDDMDDDSSNMTNEDMKGPNITNVKNGKSPGDYKGCKLLLTSRDRKVLSDKMDVKSVFCVKELDDEESLMLFKKVAGTLDEMSTFKQEIVKYCAGLPMAIVAVGRALRNKSESVWGATLEKLKKEELSGVPKSMEISIRMGYDHLESEEIRSIFLLCAQMGHQELIMDLVKYCFGLGILEGVHTLRGARDRVYTSIQKLKDLSLVLDGSSNDHFKMHDMVKDAALSIAHKEQNVFALRNSKLDDWPDKDELEMCTAISIRNCDIIDELPKVMHCPHLKFLQIDSNDPSLVIPENFFEGMEKLRVLVLTGFHLPCLPSSIKCLLNLRMLCLERCVLVDNLSLLGELKKLRILSFSGSQIESLPTELERLDKLQLFDISECSITKVAQPNFISRLTCLEELYIRKSLIKMKVDGEPNQSQISFLSQLKHLHQLRVIDLRIPSITVLPRDLFFDRLTDFKIVIGDFKMLSPGDFRMPNKYVALRSLALQLTDGADIHSQKGIKLLFKRVENLLLGELNGVQNAFYELNLDGFPDLKHLSIINNDSIKYIVNSMKLFHPQNVFLNLESLCLYRLENIKRLCYTPITDVSFAKLKIIKVKMCTRLKFLFSSYMVNFFVCLETIDVSECDNVKEIVFKEGQENFNKIELHKLRSLTLQSLPSFTSFYTGVETSSVEEQTTKRGHLEITVAEDDRSVVDPLCLFGELIEIRNLESLKLSSIKSEKIWRDKPLSNFCFQNLIKLTVKECYNLKYLCSMSVASNFKKLKGLFISDCLMMEKIFITEGDSVDKVCIFPKLEEMYLIKLNKLTDICQVEVGADSFSSLISVHIEGCEKLNKIFPSHVTGWFESLDSLKVIDCMSVEVIFEIKNFQQIDAPMKMTYLQLILVDQLPNLKHVWDRDPEGILSFKNLRIIEATDCDKLSYLLPASVAKDLKRLEGILVNICKGMEEIVAWPDGPQARLVFPEVTFMKLFGLPNVKRFYKGGHIECPNLKQLSVDLCEKLDVFTTETTNEERQAVLLAEKVISNLEFMETGPKESYWLQSNNWKYRMDRIKELSLHSMGSIDLIYWFLDRMPNLERFNLLFSRSMLEGLVPSGNIVPQERLGTVLQLKTLTLWHSAIKDLGLDRDPLLQRLEHLLISHCNNLVNLASSWLSLSHLTYLEVNSCYGLMNLMAVSTAKSMVQLATMKVIQCEVPEIVTNEGNEEDGVIEVVFSKLVYLELVRLKNLTSFCSYKNCEFKFPSLERLIVRECPKMETFTEGHTTAPKLQSILVNEGEEEGKRYWEGDLNITIQKIFQDKISFEYTKKLNLINYPELLEQVWHCSDLVQKYMFRNLTSLEVSECNNLVHIIPSHLLPCFENLEELEVRNCSAVNVIFNLNDINVTKTLRKFRLKKLSLSHLPNLEHVWDKYPERNFGLQVLQEMRVNSCHTLKYLFHALVAKDLTRLEVLIVCYCKKLVEIFSNGEIPAEGATVEFPRLITLCLTDLPGLKDFYPGLHKLEWPVLKDLSVFGCNLQLLKYQEDQPEEQPLIPIEKIPNMEMLSFDIGGTTVIWNLGSCELQLRHLQCFQEESDSVLYGFLCMLPAIGKLGLYRGSLEEVFCAERPNADYTRILLNLNEIWLLNLGNLNSIGLEHSWLHPIPENLQTLKVSGCDRLVNLVPHMVSLSNLTYLEVHSCKGMLYLFTSSTAKSLSQLKVMEIKSCESMQEIVSTEGVESHTDGEIIFEHLHTLLLKKLEKLRCFYPGNLALCFPSLKNVSLIYCNSMKTFSPVNEVGTAILSSGVTFEEEKTPQWKGDLNSTILKMYEEKISNYAPIITFARLIDPMLQDIWHGAVPVPHMCFNNLKELIVDGCQFLFEVLPFNLLPFLTKIEKLAVRNCSFVKTIFDVKCTIEDRKMTVKGPVLIPLPFSLKKLTLDQLPNLESVWNEDPCGILTIELLKEVYVDKCKCLTSLFPASVAKDLVKLEELHVKHCEELIVVVAENNADPKGTNLELSFPCLISLTLLELPKLNCFYCSLHFNTLKTSTYQESHYEDEVIGIEELTPNLLCLTLGEKELKTISQRNRLHKLKALYLVCFHVESGVFPYAFLQQVPNIEKLVVFCSSFKEIFCFQRPDVIYTELLSHTKVLILELLTELVSIGLEHSWVEPLIKNLETLEIIRCFRLRNIAASTKCFSNLMRLLVSGCHGLVNLFTPSTAKSLVRLKTMEIICCESIQEIVSNEGDASEEDETIIFEELQALYLKDLQELKCFYSGNFTVCFPSLEQVFVINCHKMENFSPGTVNADKLLGVTFQEMSDAVLLDIDLNSTIQKEFLAQVKSNSDVAAKEQENEVDAKDSL
ncbi:uncharacterized protein LOC131627481 [Vicia villosa]|uniref:uncharacterized protein LOC131627481 n=1 Tax=Vicia villosa TaxID=3911 RepID=UPI00273BAAA0|nr:uncharacterized protein LOC131627481 [Vicia villosa]